MRVYLPAVLALLVSCGGVQRGGRAPAGHESGFICEAECRRDARCGDAEAGCLARCSSLPVDSPPVWRGDWASAVASCIDGSACGHDLDEGCVFAYTPVHTKSADLCYGAGQRPGDCAVLNGLTPDADRDVAACFQKGSGDCMPDLKWK
jgi:hypothetical protein